MTRSSFSTKLVKNHMKGLTDKAQRRDESSPSPLLEQLLHNSKSGSSVEQSHHCWRAPAEIHSSSCFLIWLVVSGECESSGKNKWLNIKIFHHRVMSQFSFSLFSEASGQKSIVDKQQFSFMDVDNDAFWRWKELKCQSGCFSAPPGGPPRESWLWETGVGMGRDWRGNGQLQLNVTFTGPSVHSLRSGPLQDLRPDLRGWTIHADLSSQRGQLTGQACSSTVPTGPTAGRRLIPPWFMGTPRLCLCDCSSTEQILQTVHSPPAFSLLQHIVHALTFLSWCRRGGDRCESHWANSGERRLPSLPCSLENPPFYFFIWAPSCRTEPRVWCQKAELIALSQRGLATHHQTGPEMFYWRLLKLSLDNTDKYWATKSLQLCFHPFIDGLKCLRQKGAA